MRYHKKSDRPVLLSLDSPQLGLKLQWSMPILALALVSSPLLAHPIPCLAGRLRQPLLLCFSSLKHMRRVLHLWTGRWKNVIQHLASRMVPPRLEVLTLGECLHHPLESNSETFIEGGSCLRYGFQFYLSSRLQLLLNLDSSRSPQSWITPSLFDGTNDGVVDEWTFCEYAAVVPFLLVASQP